MKRPLAITILSLLGISLASHAASNTWTINGGSSDFLWNLTSTNWTGPGLVWTDGDDAIFGATGANAVTIDASVTAQNVTINDPGYSFASGGGATLNLAGATPTITAKANVTFSVPFTGVDGLTFQGTSTVTLQANNTFSGTTNVTSGTVVLNAPTGNANNLNPVALPGIDSLDAGATVQLFAGTPIVPLTNNSLVRSPNGQLYRNSNRLIMTGGTFDLNGDDNQNQVPAPSGTGIITNGSPYSRAVLKMSASGSPVTTFSGIIQNGNGGVVTNSIVPSNAAGTTFKVGYRTDIDLQSFNDTDTFVLAGANTYTGSTRIGGGTLSFVSGGRWGVPTNTGDPNTSTPNGSIICNGNTSTLRVDFNGTSQITGGLNGSGGVMANNANGTCSILTLGAADITNAGWPSGGGGQNGFIADNTNGGTGMVALIKTGTGTIGIHTALNTYSGFTMINNGILEFTAPGAPSPNSDHQINSPALLRLSYAGTKNVNGLFLNGVKMPAGTYSAATHPEFITGDGTVTVVELHPTAPTNLIVTLSLDGVNINVSWSGCGMFQHSTDLITWIDVPGAIAPYTEPISGPMKFFRVRY